MKRRSHGKNSPKYSLHKSSGQARVRIGGKFIYLGKFDSPESHEKYHRLIEEHWSASGETIKPPATKPNNADDVTITFLAITYATHCRSYYVMVTDL